MTRIVEGLFPCDHPGRFRLGATLAWGLLIWVLTSSALSAEAQARVVFERDGHVWITGDEGGAARRVARGTEPAPSPDGRSIAFLRRGKQFAGSYERDLFVASSRGRPNPSRLVPGAFGIAWDPTSRFIVTVRERDEKLVVASRKTRRASNFYRLDGSEAYCGTTFAPDGRLTIGCAGCTTFDSRLRVQKEFCRERYEKSALWGPPGLAVGSSNGDERYKISDAWELHLIGPGGRDTLLETSRDGYLSPVAWSASGRRLLFQHGRRASVMSLPSGSVSVLPGNALANDLSADGTRALVARPDGLHAVEVLGGSDRLIAPGATEGKFL